MILILFFLFAGVIQAEELIAYSTGPVHEAWRDIEPVYVSTGTVLKVNYEKKPIKIKN